MDAWTIYWEKFAVDVLWQKMVWAIFIGVVLYSLILSEKGLVVCYYIRNWLA